MNPLYLMAFLAFCAMLVVQRRKLFESGSSIRSVACPILASIAVFLVSLSLTLETIAPLVKAFVIHIIMYVGLGVWLPLYWNFKVEKNGFSGLGIRRNKLLISVLCNLVLGGFLTAVMIMQADWANIDAINFFKALFVLLTGNLFELIFYYGFIHLRLRHAFGPVVAVIATAFLYVLWHAGTELMLVTNPWHTALNLFIVGILFQSVFAWTYNLAIIFPFFVAGGVMLDFAVEIEALDNVAPFVGWSATAWALYVIGFMIAFKLKKTVNNSHVKEGLPQSK